MSEDNQTQTPELAAEDKRDEALSAEVKSVVKSAVAPKKFLVLHQSNLKRELLVICAFIFLVCVSRSRALSNINSLFLGGIERDAGLYVWLIKSNLRDLFSLPWFNIEPFYPYSSALGWSDNFILPSFVAAPFLFLGVPLCITYNLLMLAAMFLNGYLTYRLCFSLCGSTFAAFSGGAVFMCLGFFGGNLGHPQLQFFFCIPLAFSFAFSFLAQPAYKKAFGMALCVGAAFLCAVYYSIFLVIALGALFLATLLLKPGCLGKNEYRMLGLGGVAGFLPLVPFVVPYLAVKSAFGNRTLFEANAFAASLFSYFSASDFSWLYAQSAKFSHNEAFLFPGLMVLAVAAPAFFRMSETKRLSSLSLVFLWSFFLAGIFSLEDLHSFKMFHGTLPHLLCAFFMWVSLGSFCVLLYRIGVLERRLGFNIMTNRAILGVFLFVALLFCFISFGPLGTQEKGQVALGVFRLFYEIMPGFDSIRAVGRIGGMTLFALCVVFALMLAHYEASYRFPKWVLCCFVFVALLENADKIYQLDRVVPEAEILKQLDALDRSGKALIILPMNDELRPDGQIKSWGDFAEKNVRYMHWGFPHKIALVNGYSGQRTRLMDELPKQLKDFPATNSLRALSSIAGLQYIVYVTSYDSNYNREKFMRMLDSSQDLHLLGEDAAGNLLLELSFARMVGLENPYLLVPSYPQGRLQVELMAFAKEGSPETKVELYDTDHFGRNPIASISLKADGNWGFYSVDLPKTKERVRPLKVKFRCAAEDNVVMRRSLFVR